MLRSNSTQSNHTYDAWLARVKRVQTAYAAGRMTEADLRHYQRYIMSFGQVNANFTLEELRSLNYPKSPMMLMDKHAYIRMTENIFTEVLRQIFFITHENHKSDYPIFIDSTLFFNEIEKFATVIDGATLANSDSISSLINEISEHTSTHVWVRVTNTAEKNTIESNLKNESLKNLIEKNIPAELRPLFKQQPEELTSTQIAALEIFLADEINIITQHNQANEKPLDTEVALNERDSKWYERCFRFLKNAKHALLVDKKINKPMDLEKIANEEPQAFEQLYDAFKPLWANDILMRKNAANVSKRHGRCLMAINNWKTKRVNAVIKKVIYFVQPTFKFLNIDAIIVIGKNEEHTHEHKGPKYVINNLGYRINLSRAMDAIIDYFPKIFIDSGQTREFFIYLSNTAMVLKLDKIEQQLIKKVIDNCIDNSNIAITIPQERVRALNDAYESLTFLNCENAFSYYKNFILTYVDRFLNLYPVESVAHEVMAAELTDVLESFYRASRAGNLRQAIRATQMLCEVLQVDLAFRPLPLKQLMTHTIREQLFGDFSVQSVQMAPFGMRTYLRVLQACGAVDPLAPKIRIYQTNQNYFEWIMSLRSVKASSMSVSYVRQVQEVGNDADIVFMEIHTNNVTEKKQFAQHLDMFLLSLHDSKWKKPLTLVIDITLNALDDAELRKALEIASVKVNLGRLNIVLNISLTKLYQGGTDKKSGGLTIVINNGKDWEKFNENFNRVTKIEAIDEATLQYFSYFNQCKHQRDPKYTATIEYVKMINRSVDLFYQALLDRLARAGFEAQRCFKLTTTSDSGSIYLSLHSSQLLAVIDPGFRLKTSQIEQFNKDIVNQLLLPMSVYSDIPLSGRMSIGFPLCSVNVALDSIRFTVGVEPYNNLLTYADMIAHIFYSLNHKPGLVEACFESDDKRKAIFAGIVSDYVNQYLVAPLNRAHPYEARKPRYNKDIFGPFTTSRGPAYFYCVGNELGCRIGKEYYKTSRMAFVTGSIVTPAVAYSAEQFEFFLKCSAYTRDRNAKEIKSRTTGDDFEGYTQYMPFSPSILRIDFTEKGIGIERHFICAQSNGLTVYKHPFSHDTVGIEIDYWQEKDPAVARFIRFAIAIYIHRAHKAEFKAQGEKNNQCSMYTHLLFKMDYQNADKIVLQAVNEVLACKSELTALLYSHMSTKPDASKTPKIHRFHTEPELAHPYDSSVYDGASQTAETALVTGVINIINQHRRLSTKNIALERGFFNKAKVKEDDKTSTAKFSATL